MLRCKSNSLLVRARCRSNALFASHIDDGVRTFALQYIQHRQASNVSNSMPRVIQPSVWNSIVPKFLRKSKNVLPGAVQATQNREWNPATVFIVMFMLIGSNAINMLALRNDLKSFNSKADAQIRQLQSVIERVQNGEEVDVEKELGTGDEVREKEWEDLLREIENDSRHEEKQRQRGSKRPKEAGAGNKTESLGEEGDIVSMQNTGIKPTDATMIATPRRPARFY